ncbi:Do family serine endopeptidase, partial [Hoeflea sp.]|uniref:Do family serine endopeptidase n=1 Tax=Hoeflea sp. TaxID=1940281 RepID=UPI0019BD75B9
PFFRKFFNVPEDAQPPKQEFHAAGSGVIVDAAKGYILTNNHVVENAEDVTAVLNDGRSFKATVVGTDSLTDLAVISIKADNLSALPLGDSTKLRVGDYVVAVGNPFGLSQTATMGIVSALGRTGLGIESYEDFIQTDASINPGNSGGALVNLSGEVVGINSAIVGPSGGNVGIGFAIPVSMARQVMDQLIQHGKITRGQLGVIIQDLTPALAKALQITAPGGAMVAQVLPDSVAAAAGLKPGDVISAVDGAPVRNAAALRNIIGLKSATETVELTVLRKGEEIRVKAELSETPEQARNEQFQGAGFLDGVTLANAPSDTVKVASIDPDSKAAQAGLAEGDVIVSVNQQPVHSVDEVTALAAKQQDILLLGVEHDGLARLVVIE